jgi:hypothetical protein
VQRRAVVNATRRSLDAEFAGWSALAYRTVTSFPEGVVYVLGEESMERVKIGRTIGNVHNRIAALQTGCPSKLRLVFVLRADATLERELHARFAAQRVRGEWFRLEGDLGAFIAYCLVELAKEGRAT